MTEKPKVTAEQINRFQLLNPRFNGEALRNWQGMPPVTQFEMAEARKKLIEQVIFKAQEQRDKW